MDTVGGDMATHRIPTALDQRGAVDELAQHAGPVRARAVRVGEAVRGQEST